jgi:hypothetical protein
MIRADHDDIALIVQLPFVQPLRAFLRPLDDDEVELARGWPPAAARLTSPEVERELEPGQAAPTSPSI